MRLGAVVLVAVIVPAIAMTLIVFGITKVGAAVLSRVWTDPGWSGLLAQLS